MRRMTIITIASASALTATMLTGCPESIGPPDQETRAVFNLTSSNIIPGATAILERKQDRVEFQLISYGTPGAAYTVWLCGFDDPSACAATPCTSQELEMGVGEAFCQYGGGAIADEKSGFLSISGRSDVSSELILGDGLDEVSSAEIHLVLRNHGTGLMGEQLWQALTSFNGGCPPNTCSDEQGAVFVAPEPPT